MKNIALIPGRKIWDARFTLEEGSVKVAWNSKVPRARLGASLYMIILQPTLQWWITKYWDKEAPMDFF